MVAAFAAELAGEVRSGPDELPLASIDDGIAALRISLAALRSVAGRCDVCPADLEPDPTMTLAGA